MSDSHVIRLSKEMGITHAEFFRGLTAVVTGKTCTVGQDEALITDGKRRILIRLAPEGKRVLGLLHLPVTRVAFTFEGYCRDEAKEFMTRFERHFQRGGG